ncbi:MAG TPA: DUF4040 domain-containing protein [Mycobacteriales bacterium]|nr:DUF4040 domain-containing protein [Mycobacteriales bacterium]
MTGFWVMDYLCLALVLGAALLVVRIQNLAGAAMALSALGTVLTVLFVVLGAPDDAHSEAVVGAIALPALYLIAIGKVRADVGGAGEEGKRRSADGGTGADR